MICSVHGGSRDGGHSLRVESCLAVARLWRLTLACCLAAIALPGLGQDVSGLFPEAPADSLVRKVNPPATDRPAARGASRCRAYARRTAAHRHLDRLQRDLLRGQRAGRAGQAACRGSGGYAAGPVSPGARTSARRAACGCGLGSPPFRSLVGRRPVTRSEHLTPRHVPFGCAVVAAGLQPSVLHRF